MISWLTERAWPVIQSTIDEWNEDGGSTIAAATAYYAAFSFFPLLLVLSAALGYFLRVSDQAQSAREQLVLLIALNTSSSLASQVDAMLTVAQESPGVSGPLGVAGLLIGAMGVFAQLDNAFDHIWDIPAPESAGIIVSVQRILHGRLKAFLVMLGLGLLVVLAFIVGIVMRALEELTTQQPAGRLSWRVFQTLFSIGIYTLFFSLIYTLIPRRQVAWRDALPGALLAAIVWEAGRQLLAGLIIGTKYSSAYGLVGSFIALMVWIYYASTVLFLGAEFVQVFCKVRESGTPPQRPAAQPEYPAPMLSALPSASEKAAYAAGGAILGAICALLVLPIALGLAVLRRIRRR